MSQSCSFNFWKTLDNSFYQDDPIPDIRPANIYPSEASVEYTDGYGDRVVEGACLRKSWFRIKLMQAAARTRESFIALELGGVTHTIEATKPNATSMWRFRAGDYWESMVKEQARQAGILISAHKKFFKELRYGYTLSGELDFVVKNPFTSKPLIVEKKSYDGYEQEKQIAGWRGRKGSPKTQNVLQTSIYLDQWPEVECGKLVYMSRGKLLRTEFDITVDTKGTIYVDGKAETRFNLHDIYNRFNTLALHLHNNTVPPRDYTLNYTDQEMLTKIKRGQIAKTNREAFEKWYNREKEIKETGKGRKLKRPSCGDWACNPLYCSFSGVCYKPDGTPRNFSSV